MLYEEELQKYLRRYNVFPIRFVSKTCKEVIVLDVSQEEFMKFLKLKEASIVYYNYEYYDKQDYLITETEDIEEYAKFNAEIEAYNAKVETLEFDKPYQLTLMFIAEGIAYVVEYLDEWIEKIDDIMQGDIAIDSIQNAYSAENIEERQRLFLNSKELKRQQNLKRAKEELLELLLKDEKFKLCTNQRLRQSYAADLRTNHPDIAKLFYSEQGLYVIGQVKDVIELVFKCIKEGKVEKDEIMKYI